MEQGSGFPVDASISWGEVTVVTDARGRFSLQVPEGEVSLVVEADEHRGATVVVQATGEPRPLKIRLERYTWIDEVVVYGEGVREDVSRKVYSAEELRGVPGSFGDPIRALQSLPGVARPGGLEGDLVVRGAEGVNTATFIDGVPVPWLFHWFMGRSVINPTILDDVEFYPGGMPSRFGAALQAAVNARVQQDEPPPGVHGRITVDILDASMAIEGKAGPVTWAAAGRYAWVGGLIGAGSRLTALGQGLGPDEGGWVSPDYYDYTGRVSWEEGPHTLTLMGFGARDALILHPPESAGIPGASLLPFDPNRLLDSSFHRVQLRHGARLGMWTLDSWLAGGVQQESNLLRGIGLLANGPEFGKVSGSTIHGRHDGRGELSDRVAMRYGTELEVIPVTAEDYAGMTSLSDVPTSKDVAVRGGLWLEVQNSFGPVWISPGIRGSLHSFNGGTHVEPEPRVSLRWQADDRWALTAFAGRFTQRPPAERYLEALGNADLPLMSAWQASVGTEARWTTGLEIDATVYGTLFDDLVVNDPRVELIEEEAADGSGTVGRSVVVPNWSAARGWAFGGELLVRWRPAGRFFGWVAVTASRTLRQSPDGVVHPGDFDQPLAITLVGAWRAPKLWRLSGRARVTSGHPFTPFDGAFDPWRDDWQAVPGATNSGRFPWFFQLDVRIQKTWVKKRSRFTLYVDVFNATNTRNPLLASYRPDFSERITTLWIPIVPNLGVEVDF